jgi:hypothetical protein
MRARPHHAHVALENVEELRQLVDTGSPDESADAGDAVVAPRGRNDPVAIGLILGHAAKLVHLEKAVRATDALLDEQDRPAIFEFDRQCDHRHQRREHDNRAGGADNVEYPLDGARAQPERPHRNQQHALVANHPGTLCAKLPHLLVEHLALDIRALEQHRPGGAAFERAAHHHPVDIPQHAAHPIENARIVEIGADAQRLCRGDDRSGDFDHRPAIIDDQLVAHVHAAPPAHECAHRQAAPGQHGGSERCPGEKADAGELLARFGHECDQRNEQRRQDQRNQRAADAKHDVADRIDRVAAVVQGDCQKDRHDQLGGHQVCRNACITRIQKTRDREARQQGNDIDDNLGEIALKASPFERWRQQQGMFIRVEGLGVPDCGMDIHRWTSPRDTPANAEERLGLFPYAN